MLPHVIWVKHSYIKVKNLFIQYKMISRASLKRNHFENYGGTFISAYLCKITIFLRMILVQREIISDE